jgi:hypothetical protein
MIDEHIVKQLNHVEILDQVAFESPLAGFQQVRDVELIERLDLEGFVLVDNHRLRLGVVSTHICDVIVWGL